MSKHTPQDKLNRLRQIRAQCVSLTHGHDYTDLDNYIDSAMADALVQIDAAIDRATLAASLTRPGARPTVAGVVAP
jgi:hypothetical protein